MKAFIAEDDPRYPLDRYRRGGRIELEVEVIHDDDDGQALADECWAVLGRFLRGKGCEVDGGSMFYEPGGLWLEVPPEDADPNLAS